MQSSKHLVRWRNWLSPSTVEYTVLTLIYICSITDIEHYSNWHIGLVSRVFANGPGDQGSIPSCVIPKTLKLYLIPPCLTLSNIRYISRVKWSNPGKRVVLSPTPRCSSYWKRSLRVALNYGRQLLYYYDIYIYIYTVIHRQTVSLYRNSSVWLDT